MVSQVYRPCGQTPCEAVSELQAILPKGAIWRISGDRVFGRMCHAIAEAKSYLMDCICKEWGEADPCKAELNLSRHAKILCFPVDCVELTSEKMCKWVELIYSCPPGSEGFLIGLLEFAGVTDVELEFDDGDCTGATCCGASITIKAPFANFTEGGCECEDDLIVQMNHDCGAIFIPEIECLRGMYFPYGVQVKYQASDCDPDFMRTISS